MTFPVPLVALAVRRALPLDVGEHLAVPAGAQVEIQKAGAGNLHLLEVAALQLQVIHNGLSNGTGGLVQSLGSRHGKGGGVVPVGGVLGDLHRGGLHLRLGQRPVRHCRLIGGHGQRRRLVLRVLYHVDHIVPSFVNEEFRMRNFGVRQSRTDSNCHLRRHRNS